MDTGKLYGVGVVFLTLRWRKLTCVTVQVDGSKVGIILSSPALFLEVLEDAMMETRAHRKRPRPDLKDWSGPSSATFRDGILLRDAHV